jgi:hypothetical protein
MTHEIYREHRFQRRSLDMITRVNQIIEEYAAQGFTLIVRQIHYQFVARGWTANTSARYQSLSSTLTNARDAGLVDWNAIEDRSRSIQRITTWENPAEILADAADWYNEDLWASQPRHIEIWVEKDSLAGMFDAVHRDYRVPIYPHRGGDSTSNMRAAGVRLAQKVELGSEPLILHFTDHDPTGLDMRRDAEERLEFYARQPIEVRVLGLTKNQVAQYQPPPNFAKEKDPRYPAYVREHGPHCWELDALPPDMFDRLARDAIEAELDHDAWKEALAHERRNRSKLAALVKKMTPKRR